MTVNSSKEFQRHICFLVFFKMTGSFLQIISNFSVDRHPTIEKILFWVWFRIYRNLYLDLHLLSLQATNPDVIDINTFLRKKTPKVHPNLREKNSLDSSIKFNTQLA